MWDSEFIYKGKIDTQLSCNIGTARSTAFCNLIEDQPLFYADNIDEEEMFLDFDLISSRIETLRRKIDSYDRNSEILAQASLSEQAVIPALVKGVDGKTDIKKHAIADIIAYGQESALFCAYHDFSIKSGITFDVSCHTRSASFHKERNIIYINPYLEPITATRSLIRVMRTAWIVKQGLGINPLALQPEEAVMVHRLLAADQDVTEVSYLWDLKLAGHHQAWSRAISTTDKDLLSTYAVEAMTDFRSIKSGVAARATFQKWFMSDRCRNYDRQIIQAMLGHYADIEINSAHASKLVATEIVIRLGHRPIGKNYLAAISSEIMFDTLYRDVRDRSNANFLWFIAFERRMAEMEQQLHGEDTKKESSVPTSYDRGAINSDQYNEADNIYQLPDATGAPRSMDASGSGAVLFVLDHFRAG